jgi:VCBS repeat-containing protein
VKRNGNTPPLSVKAIVRQSGPNLHRNEVSLKAPNVGAASKYVFYRALGSTVNSSVEQLCVAAITPVTPLRPSTPGNPVPNCNASTTFVDTEELPYNQQFTYFVRAIFSDCNPAVIATCQSGPSNLSTVDPTVNSAPVAVADPTYTVVQNKALDVPAPGVLGNDTDEDSPASILKVAVITATPAHGTLVLNPNGSFTYTPQNGYSGTDTFKYRVDDGKWRSTNISMSALSNEVTVTITVTKKK